MICIHSLWVWVGGGPPPLWVWLRLGGMKRHDLRSSPPSCGYVCVWVGPICKFIWYGDERKYLHDFTGVSIEMCTYRDGLSFKFFMVED